MKKRGFIIYPGKLTTVDSFRIGCIGILDERIMKEVVASVASCFDAMGVRDRSPQGNFSITSEGALFEKSFPRAPRKNFNNIKIF